MEVIVERIAMQCHTLIPVTDASSIGETRRTAMRLAEVAQLGDEAAGRASIVATELATNLLRHAGAKQRAILIAAVNAGGQSDVELMSIDNGPGMNDIAKCFADGFSTAGTPGNGLGAIKRLSDEMDLLSSSTGTVIWSRIGSVPRGPGLRREPPLRIGAVCVPATDETVCGDAWRVLRADDGGLSLLVADGLGHGPLAAEASNAARECFEEATTPDLCAIVQAMHTRLSHTRGAAVAVARVDHLAGKLTFAGVGNIAGTLLDPAGASRGLFSHNGIVGHQVRKVQAFEYPWALGSTLILHSDGLQTRWSLDDYPGLRRRNPSVIAAVLYRDFRRGRDDASVVAVRSTAGEA